MVIFEEEPRELDVCFRQPEAVEIGRVGTSIFYSVCLLGTTELNTMLKWLVLSLLWAEQGLLQKYPTDIPCSLRRSQKSIPMNYT